MKRILVAVAALAGMSGCYGTTYVESSPGYATTSYQTTTEYAPYDDPGPVTVTVAPPPLRYEPVGSCGFNSIWFPGRWEFRSNWYWARGYCTETRPGYVYVAPRYVNGVYYRAHWGRAGGAVYGGGGVYGGTTYVPPPRPAPVYGGGYVAPAPVRPAPVYGGGSVYVAPTPAPVRPAPVYGGGGYVAPAPVRPAYGGGGYVAPTPAPVRPAPVYVPPPGGGGVRPAPAPYRPVPPPYHR